MSRTVLLLAAAVLSAMIANGAPLVMIGEYPAPVAEIRDYIAGWLDGQGMMVVKETRGPDGIVLDCAGNARNAGNAGNAGNAEKVRISIRPNSPLASVVTLSGAAASGTFAGKMKSALTSYTKNSGEDDSGGALNIPRAVDRHRKNVVCLNASVGGETIDFTGFVINRDGMIVSTAHDLDGIRDVTVSFDNGQKLGGEIVRRDPARDLSLIRVAGPLAGVIPVNGGRDRLKRGEKVFSLICPAHDRGASRMGVVDEPPAISNGQRLWQVRMGVTLGDSGGPVLDAGGRLVGVVKGRFRGGRSRGFLIPVGTLKEFLGSGGK